MTKRKIIVWDLPTRLFHWLLVLSIASLWLSAEVIESFDIHGKIGLFVVGLIAFRLAYGLLGGDTVRFNRFVKGKRSVIDYLQGRWRGVGHNPLGGWSVVALLSFTLLTALTGLLANNEGDFSGPLAFLVTTDTSDFFSGIHETFFNVLLLLIGLHVLAIGIYKVVFAEDLVKPMIAGETEVDADLAESVRPAKVWALVLSLVVAVLAIWGASGVWHQPPAKPVVSTPDW